MFRVTAHTVLCDVGSILLFFHCCYIVANMTLMTNTSGIVIHPSLFASLAFSGYFFRASCDED